MSSPDTAQMPSLSVVIPVFNQPLLIGRTIERVSDAIERSGFSRSEIVVVVADQPTRDAIAKLRPRLPLRVLDEEEPGRFAARRQGVQAATGELVLLLDSRVSIAPDALRFVSERIPSEERLPIWTAHIEFDKTTAYGRFWDVIIPLVWWRYYSKPRTTSFGLDEYDRFTKATTCFIAPRSMLLKANSEFTSFYSDTRYASDDTGLIRLLAAHQPINISPHFACVHTPYKGYRAFMRNVREKGMTFPDSYGRPGTRFFPLLIAFYPACLLAAAVARLRPRLALQAATALPLGLAAVTMAYRRNRADAIAVAWIGPNWLLGMCIGLWRGLWMALRTRLRHGRQ